MGNSQLPSKTFSTKLPAVAGKNGSRGVGRGPTALRTWRERRGISKQGLAEMLGLKHAASVHQYERGMLPLTYSRLVALQRLTGISIWTLAWPGQRVLLREIAAAVGGAEAAGA
jgi:transcriptional regulator with XRE-family HTH domain